MNTRDAQRALQGAFGDARWPKPLNVLQGLSLMRRGQSAPEAARSVGTTAAVLSELRGARNPLARVLGLPNSTLKPDDAKRNSQILGNLLLGRGAEVAFERIYRSELGDREFALQDEREGQTDTDYRLLNGNGRPIFRINIKFHGSQFRRAAEMVGLEPEDCFALATYKIWSALQKQDRDELPFLFLIVGVPNLRAEDVGQQIPQDIVELCGLFKASPKAAGKRAFENAVIEDLVTRNAPVFMTTLAAIQNANWYVLSARRAHALLRDNLFERAYALKIRGFAQQFRNAELDMHFSLTTELTPLREFLVKLREDGVQRVTTLTERGAV